MRARVVRGSARPKLIPVMHKLESQRGDQALA